jgi:hypothetical protein
MGRGRVGSLGVDPLWLPLIRIAAVDPVILIFSSFLLAPILELFAFLATVAHDTPLPV